MNINPFEMMKQLGSLESRMKAMKEEISKITAEGSSGAGLVSVTLNGEYQVQKFSINPVIIEKSEKDTMEVLIQSAFNDASQKIKKISEEFMMRELQNSGLGGVKN